MRKSTHTFGGTTIPFKRILATLLVLAFPSQLVFAGALSKTSVNPSTSPSSERLVLLPDFQADSRLLPLVTSFFDAAEQPKAAPADKTIAKVKGKLAIAKDKRRLAIAKDKRRLASNHVTLGKCLTGPEGLKSTNLMAGCRDDCLVYGLGCIAISILSGCAPCGLVCLAIEAYCLSQCSEELNALSTDPRPRHLARK
jgi:hypothetical protein